MGCLLHSLELTFCSPTFASRGVAAEGLQVAAQFHNLDGVRSHLDYLVVWFS
jgi:hypothetical protein